MSNKRRYARLVLVLITSLLLSSCAETTDPGPVEVDPRFGGVFSYASSSEPLSVDTHYESDSQMQPLQALVMESLITFGEGYSVIPLLAESWEVSHNDTMYTFYLRRGVRFHNGKEMTSEDVIASLARYFDAGYRASAFENVLSFEALDDYTVRVEIVQPTAAFLYNLAMPEGALHIYPKEIIEGRPKNDLNWEDLIGTGPYQLVEHRANDVTIFRRFEDYQPYPGKRDGLGGAKISFFDEIRHYVVPDYAERMAGLREGEFDWIEGDGHDLEAVDSDRNISVTLDEHAGAYHLLFNHAAAPTGDLKLRQAVRAVLDIEAFGMAVWEGCSPCFRLNHSLWPVFSYHYINDQFSEDLYLSKDLQMAKVLLQTSSYEGQKLVCAASTKNQAYINTCQFLRTVLGEKLGIDVEVQVFGHDELLYRLSQDGTWHFTVMAFPNVTRISPDWYTMAGEGDPAPASIRSGYANPEMDAAITRLEIATTYEQRLGCLDDIQRIAYEDVVDVKLWDITKPWFHRSDIKGYEGWYVARFFGVWRE